MAATKYYPEDVLVEKFQSNEYGWLDYVNHHSPEWQEEFTAFCKERDLTINEESTTKPNPYVYQIKHITNGARLGTRATGHPPA